MVPRFCTISSRFMPMPVSAMVRVLASSSTVMRIASSASASTHVVVGEHLELDAVERIGRIGNQLAQEDLAVCIERVGQDIQQLFDLGAVFERFGGCRCVRHVCLQNKQLNSIRMTMKLDCNPLLYETE